MYGEAVIISLVQIKQENVHLVCLNLTDEF